MPAACRAQDFMDCLYPSGTGYQLSVKRQCLLLLLAAGSIQHINAMPRSTGITWCHEELMLNKGRRNRTLAPLAHAMGNGRLWPSAKRQQARGTRCKLLIHGNVKHGDKLSLVHVTMSSQLHAFSSCVATGHSRSQAPAALNKITSMPAGDTQREHTCGTR